MQKLIDISVIKVLPEDKRILNKSKKVECLTIPAYVLKTNINNKFTPINNILFSKLRLGKLTCTCNQSKNLYERNIEKNTIEISIRITIHLGIYLKSVSLTILSPLYSAVKASVSFFIQHFDISVIAANIMILFL